MIPLLIFSRTRRLQHRFRFLHALKSIISLCFTSCLHFFNFAMRPKFFKTGLCFNCRASHFSQHSANNSISRSEVSAVYLRRASASWGLPGTFQISGCSALCLLDKSGLRSTASAPPLIRWRVVCWVPAFCAKRMTLTNEDHEPLGDLRCLADVWDSKPEPPYGAPASRSKWSARAAPATNPGYCAATNRGWHA